MDLLRSRKLSFRFMTSAAQKLLSCNTNLHHHTLTTNNLEKSALEQYLVKPGGGHVLGTSGEAIENKVILQEKVGCNRINRNRLLGAIGSTITGYPWENRLQSDTLPVGWVTYSGPTHALGRVAAKLKTTYEQPNQ